MTELRVLSDYIFIRLQKRSRPKITVIRFLFPSKWINNKFYVSFYVSTLFLAKSLYCYSVWYCKTYFFKLLLLVNTEFYVSGLFFTYCIVQYRIEVYEANPNFVLLTTDCGPLQNLYTHAFITNRILVHSLCFDVTIFLATVKAIMYFLNKMNGYKHFRGQK